MTLASAPAPIEDTPDAGDPSHECLDPSLPTFDLWCAEPGPGPTIAGYGGGGGTTQNFVQHGSSLPFTGLDVLLLVGAAVLVILAGVTLRKVGRA